jgi:4-hydroxy-L-threonine phosphate dehydrogenase PdxA
MLMVQGNLRVGLLTDHIPVSEVASRLTEDLIMKSETVRKSLIQLVNAIKSINKKYSQRNISLWSFRGRRIF